MERAWDLGSRNTESGLTSEMPLAFTNDNLNADGARGVCESFRFVRRLQGYFNTILYGASTSTSPKLANAPPLRIYDLRA